MTSQIRTGSVHHLTLTVTDVARSGCILYRFWGFKLPWDGPRLRWQLDPSVCSPDPTRAISGDRFDENRVGLDHLSFSVTNLGDLEVAARAFDEAGVERGEINDLGADLGLYVLAFRDPDNIQLELTAPYGD